MKQARQVIAKSLMDGRLKFETSEAQADDILDQLNAEGFQINKVFGSRTGAAEHESPRPGAPFEAYQRFVRWQEMKQSSLAVMTSDVVEQLSEILGVDLCNKERSTIYLAVSEPVIIETRGVIVHQNKPEDKL